MRCAHYLVIKSVSLDGIKSPLSKWQCFPRGSGSLQLIEPNRGRSGLLRLEHLGNMNTFLLLGSSEAFRNAQTIFKK